MFPEETYEAFFDELSQLEKRSMLEKHAAWFSGAARGFRQLYKQPISKGIGQIGTAWKAGVRRGMGLPKGQTASLSELSGKGLLGGAKMVSKLPVVRAGLTAGAGGLAAYGGYRALTG